MSFTIFCFTISHNFIMPVQMFCISSTRIMHNIHNPREISEFLFVLYRLQIHVTNICWRCKYLCIRQKFLTFYRFLCYITTKWQSYTFIFPKRKGIKNFTRSWNICLISYSENERKISKWFISLVIIYDFDHLSFFSKLIEIQFKLIVNIRINHSFHLNFFTSSGSIT